MSPEDAIRSDRSETPLVLMRQQIPVQAPAILTLLVSAGMLAFSAELFAHGGLKGGDTTLAAGFLLFVGAAIGLLAIVISNVWRTKKIAVELDQNGLKLFPDTGLSANRSHHYHWSMIEKFSGAAEPVFGFAGLLAALLFTGAIVQARFRFDGIQVLLVELLIAVGLMLASKTAWWRRHLHRSFLVIELADGAAFRREMTIPITSERVTVAGADDPELIDRLNGLLLELRKPPA